MDQQRDREQLERKLDLCRRLSGAASDPTTSIRLAKLIEELEHSLRQGEYSPARAGDFIDARAHGCGIRQNAELRERFASRFRHFERLFISRFRPRIIVLP